MKLLAGMPRPGNTWLVLLAALGVGLLAALGARHYFSSRIAQIEASAARKMVQVVVAKTALHKGDVLSAANLAVREVPVDYTHATAVRPDEFEHLDGERLGYDVTPGEPILWGLLETKRAPTFSARVSAGRRAVTVPVDEINSISGLLEPGDTIDLVVTVDQQGRKKSVVLLQGVSVMATGQRSVDDPKTGESRQYATVTLDATPDAARNLILARETGRVTALLRNPSDLAEAGTSGDLNALLYGNPTPARARTASLQVPVIYGGSPSVAPPALRLNPAGPVADGGSGASPP